MRLFWTPSERYELISRYSTEGADAIAKSLGRSTDSVTSQCYRYRLRSQTRRQRQARTKAEQCKTVNARFFDQMTPDVAYVLGSLWAGGTVRLKHRQVIRLSMNVDRLPALQSVLQLMHSQHQVQCFTHRIVAEICNSRLTQTLMERFGRPGTRPQQPALPNIPETLLPEFAQGFLDTSGYQNSVVIRWSGNRETIQELRAKIRVLADVPEPLVNAAGQHMSIAWTTIHDVKILHRWLRKPQQNNQR